MARIRATTWCGMVRQGADQLAQKTGRNVIVYYSGWLHKVGLPSELFSLNDADKNGFMSAIHTLDRSKGFDLVLHTPGGEIAATESLVDYLRSMFGKDIRAIVPQLAMSARTMIALSCKSVLMGKESSLGPIDPQIGGIPAHGVIEEFKRASEEIADDPSKTPVWQPIDAISDTTLYRALADFAALCRVVNHRPRSSERILGITRHSGARGSRQPHRSVRSTRRGHVRVDCPRAGWCATHSGPR